MKIKSARMERGLLIIETPDLPEAFRFVSSYKPGEDYSIMKTKQKRSLDANAYCWVLLDKISSAEAYLKSHYPSWDESKLIYRK